jgi:hypothetical protein
MTVELSDADVRRFWAKVNKNGPFPTNPELGRCWIWTGSKFQSFGYGVFALCRRPLYAHRVAYGLAKGPAPDGLCVLHHCDNPPCVNEAHLFLGTRADNMADKVRKKRQHRGEQTGGVVLTDSMVAQILALYSAGQCSAMSLAKEYSIDEATIRAIINGMTWKHVAGPRLSRAEIVALGKKHRADGARKAKISCSI